MTNFDLEQMREESQSLKDRQQTLNGKMLTYRQHERNYKLELLQDRSFATGLTGEERVAAAQARADQLIQEKHARLYNFIARESAEIEAIRVRNEAIIATGWASQFENNSYISGLRSRFTEPKEISSGTEE